ncbi:MAG: hypothetical protein RMZ41_017945 [Nostoc sp. DedVER02]|uniref:hypothetical protein n=1 Tax=unclassified Nostoc TaxID=2593658 RepID=UPI002AD3A900|nr:MULTISPECIES: hypothetical protein [unclassified Nostoc]MDZ7985269.1 hypothetical protein [Nostoc sp. DedVER02]MDZ8115207.1 hypothetical protein [Nostoc sp. DedVER01b]
MTERSRLLPQASVSSAAHVSPPERAHFRSSSSSLVLALTELTQLAQRDNFWNWYYQEFT